MLGTPGAAQATEQSGKFLRDYLEQATFRQR
jgi:hypothetical protein